jgi:hypothetical protein
VANLGDVKIPMRDVMRKVSLSVHVTGRRTARWRMWIACRLIHLAGVVMGVGRVDVDTALVRWPDDDQARH